MNNLRIEVVKNKETSLIIDDIGTAIKENNILKDGYLKAIEALRRYIDQTDIVRNKLNQIYNSDSQINDVLYQSPHNIIAFSGKRGTGKTSAMISFAEFLKSMGENSADSKERWNKDFKDRHTLVLSPIDPTMLENDQDILSVVLSRLLYKAEERWNRNIDFHRGAQSLEKNKNDLLKKANSCLNGILAVKKKGEIKSLADLQRIGDSAVLKKNLFDFVDLVNTFCLGGEHVTPESCVLVIPIDDTDCQIQKAHEVMEDIRRYLTLPNVIILMATDGDMLRTVIAQHYAAEFKTGIDREYLDKVKMVHYAEKYLTKLIPGTQRVYLPIFESILDGNSSKLELGYYDDESKDKDLISETTRLEREQNQGANHIDYNFQAKVLTYIFRRTGIVFIDHNAYINDIIPTTMRGLAHLLNFLYHMKEVEKIDYTRDYESQELIEKAEKHFTAIKYNLDLFEEYFMNEWVPAKVDGEMARILKGIQEQVNENIIRYAFDEMCDKYIDKEGTANGYNRNDGDSYYKLLEMLSGINDTIVEPGIAKTFKHKADFYNTFAVRTLLTIKKNKQAIKIKLEAVRKANENKEGIINYSSYKLSEFLPHRTLDKNAKGIYSKKMEPVVEVYSKLLEDSIVIKNEQTHLERFCMQELSWIVLCNWEVQDVIYKAVEKCSKLEEDEKPEELWKHIQEDIFNKNCGLLYPMKEKWIAQIDNWPTEFIEICAIDKENSNDDEEGNMGSGTEQSMINQIIVKIESKLADDSVRNPAIMKDSLDEMISGLKKKKEELVISRDTMNLLDETDKRIIEQYDEMIIRFEKNIDTGNTILKKTEELKGIKLETTQSSEKDGALIKEIKKWLSDIKKNNRAADRLLYSEIKDE